MSWMYTIGRPLAIYIFLVCYMIVSFGYKKNVLLNYAEFNLQMQQNSD